MKRLLLVACIAFLGPGSTAAQPKSPPKTEAEGQLRALRDWSLSRTLRVRAADTVFPAWVSAVERHVPGAADEAAIQVGGWPGEDLDLVVKWIYLQVHASEEVRQTLGLMPRPRLAALARRGAVLHGDIALRVQTARQTTLRISPFTYSALQGQDGRDAGALQPSVHLEVGRALLAVVRDAGLADARFDSLWFAATAAPMLRVLKVGLAAPHLRAGLGALPDDPRLLFYGAAGHELMAAPGSRWVLEAATTPIPRGVHWDVASEHDELDAAEQLLTRAMAVAPDNAEIRLHRGRVFARLGEHTKAVQDLSAVEGKLADPELAYYAALFLGGEEAALGRREAARAAFERAAALFPAAQSPLLGLSDLARRYGDRGGAIAAMRRMFALPPLMALRGDPWWDYYASHVRDWDELLTALYSYPAREGTR